MAPLASLDRTTSVPSSGGFDDFDDLLNASSRPSTKKSKSKSSVKRNKKSSSKKKFNVDDSGDFGSPASGGALHSPLSPNLGDSFDNDVFSGINPPRGTGTADLDDSILGGLLGGPSKPTRGVARAKTSGDVLGDAADKDPPAPMWSARGGGSGSISKAGGADGVSGVDKGEESPLPASDSSASRSVPETSTRARPSLGRFQSVPNLGREEGGRSAGSSMGERAPMAKHSSVRGFGGDREEGSLDLDLDLDALLPDSSQAEAQRPPTNAGRRRNAKDSWPSEEEGSPGRDANKKGECINV